MSSASIDDYKIVITRKKIKNLILSIDRNGTVKLSVPNRASKSEIHNFILSRKHWIDSQLNKVNRYTKQTIREYKAGEVFYYLGKAHILKIIDTDQVIGSEIKITDKYLNIYLNKNILLAPSYIINKWYRAQCNILAESLLLKWQDIIGVKVSSYNLGYLKTRWGSCRPDTAHIWLNIDLIQMPRYCLEYVIVHELIHLIEPSHNHKFKSLMDKYLPDWRDIKNNLNKFVLEHDLGRV